MISQTHTHMHSSALMRGLLSTAAPAEEKEKSRLGRRSRSGTSHFTPNVMRFKVAAFLLICMLSLNTLSSCCFFLSVDWPLSSL